MVPRAIKLKYNKKYTNKKLFITLFYYFIFQVITLNGIGWLAFTVLIIVLRQNDGNWGRRFEYPKVQFKKNCLK